MQYLGARHLLAPVSSRTLLQAYNAQQFDAKTIGLKYSEGDRRRLLNARAPTISRGLLQAYNVQQFDAETIGLKYSEGDRRRLLGKDAPAASTYRTVTLGVNPGPSLSLVRCHPWPCIEDY